MSIVRVLIADDSDAFRGALHDLVEATPGFVLVGEADSGEAAVIAAATAHPDLVLIDIRMPGIGGVDAAEQILAASPETTVVMITADGGGSIVDPNRFAIADKRTLGPMALIGLWDSARRR
jgi:DNA-binding NarL/FixJ family response regulator